MNINTKKGTVRLTKPEAAILTKAQVICAGLHKHADSQEADVAADALKSLLLQYAGQPERNEPLLDMLNEKEKG